MREAAAFVLGSLGISIGVSGLIIAWRIWRSPPHLWDAAREYRERGMDVPDALIERILRKRKTAN